MDSRNGSPLIKHLAIIDTDSSVQFVESMAEHPPSSGKHDASETCWSPNTSCCCFAHAKAGYGFGTAAFANVLPAQTIQPSCEMLQMNNGPKEEHDETTCDEVGIVQTSSPHSQSGNSSQISLSPPPLFPSC